MENLPEVVFIAKTNGEVYVTEDEEQGTEYVRSDIVLSVGDDLAAAREVLNEANSQMNLIFGKFRALLLGLGFDPEDANNWIANVAADDFKQLGGHWKFHSNATMKITGTKCSLSPRLILLN
jgi:hypothetical protein